MAFASTCPESIRGLREFAVAQISTHLQLGDGIGVNLREFAVAHIGRRQLGDDIRGRFREFAVAHISTHLQVGDGRANGNPTASV